MIKIITTLLLLIATQSNYATPIEGRQFGVEFNIPRLLSYNKAWRSLSGSFSYFNHHNNTEIAFPWLLAKFGYNDDDSAANNYNTSDDNDFLTTKSIDMHYRKFYDNQLNGFYMSAFARVTHLDGYVYTHNNSLPTPSSETDKPSYQRNSEKFKKLRFGLGIGLGYRVFSQTNRLYWGTGIILGRYIDDTDYDLVNDGGFFAESPPIIVDAELLKFGYAF